MISPMIDYKLAADPKSHAVVARRGEVVILRKICLQPSRPRCLEMVGRQSGRAACSPVEIDAVIDFGKTMPARVRVAAQEAGRARIQSAARNQLKELTRAEPV